MTNISTFISKSKEKMQEKVLGYVFELQLNVEQAP